MTFILKISVVGMDELPPDWKVHVIKTLKDTLESLPLKDYQIMINDVDPVIVEFKEERKK